MSSEQPSGPPRAAARASILARGVAHRRRIGDPPVVPAPTLRRPPVAPGDVPLVMHAIGDPALHPPGPSEALAEPHPTSDPPGTGPRPERPGAPEGTAATGNGTQQVERGRAIASMPDVVRRRIERETY